MERGIKLPTSPSEWGFKGENYLLVIGIDKYEHWKPLHNAVKDIRDITRLLTARYQFEPSRVITLTDEEATEDNIRKQLLDIKRTIMKDDNLVVFYSGHGFYDPDLDEGYWVPANARKDKPSDYISNSDVLKWIRAIKTHHTLILVDSCFSGTLVSQSRSEVLSEKYPSCRIFASGRKELVDDGVPGSNSPFAKAILSRLSYNSDRVLRASDLINNVTKAVESHGGQAPIEGRIKEAGDEGGEFVFHLKVTEEEIWDAVTSANTPDEYRKYLEYFPDGKYAVSARAKVSELTDGEDWTRAVELNTSQAYMQYLELHPKGARTEDAISCLEELEENDAWQKAKTRNTVSAFMDYLRKYPNGRFEVVAKRSLDAIKKDLQQSEHHLIDDELENINVASSVSQDNKDRYKILLSEAEDLYARMNYRESVERYKQALALNQPHFVPNKAFVVQRIDQAQKRISYGEYIIDGEDALSRESYDLALEYFRKAQSFEETQQVVNLINVALRRGKDVKLPDIPVQKRKKKKLVSASCAVTLSVVGVLAAGAFFILNLKQDPLMSRATDPSSLDTATTYATTTNPDEMTDVNTRVMTDRDNDGIDDSTDPNPAQYDDPISERKKAADKVDINYTPSITGTWYVADRVIAGISSAQLGTLNPASWTFYDDGSVYYQEGSISLTGTWNLTSDGTQIQTDLEFLGAFPARILEINQNGMVWETNENLYGSQVMVTNYLVRN